MAAPQTQKQYVLALAEERGILSRADLREADLPETYLSQLASEGKLAALAPGVYMAKGYEPAETLDLAVVAKKVPSAVLMGISALQFHGLTTHLAHSVQIAIERGRWTPSLDWPPIEVFHISSRAFSAGIETHLIETSVELRVYSVAKTIADLFKFRHTFGLDVALDALKEGWREGRFEMSELDTYADVCRVRGVMRPYLEMLS